jgi:hypothetical protein
MKKILLSLIAFFAFADYSFSSSIGQMNLSDLHEKADLIVLAQVTSVRQKGNYDEITIKIDSLLKGKTEERELSFMLSVRGGLKDFDPQLKIGNTGVFFLNKNGNEVNKAYWGSVALFPDHIFKLKEGRQ